jgi:hypothetical protein
MNAKISKDDVERLSKGLRSKSRSGSRSIPHRLNKKERIIFETAKNKGFLKIPICCTRRNVINIYQLWCEATGIECRIITESKIDYSDV